MPARGVIDAPPTTFSALTRAARRRARRELWCAIVRKVSSATIAASIRVNSNRCEVRAQGIE